MHISVFFISLCHDYNKAAWIANLAAGISVSKPGTYAPSVEDLTIAITTKYHNILNHNSIIYANDLKSSEFSDLINLWRTSGLNIGFTNGCFDILHFGHISSLFEAKSFCDKLIVGINSDASVKKLKGDSRPYQPEVDRARILMALEPVDLVIIFDDETPLELIKLVTPSVLMKVLIILEQVVGSDYVRSQGGVVKLLKTVEDRSTTSVAAKF